MQSPDLMQIIQNILLKQQQMEEKCQEMVEILTELENFLAKSKKENKELMEKGKAQEEGVQINSEEVD
ncbi:hypothetical protein TIFTF001_016525 [Ficus carica]|uniref:Uncharacterized protein n=1 Tax=Ficus carica TaxID=3494 RepID=A0AA88AAN2_FICCA|nr:hypothetical protein TIFTF001_016525 [Ficus carica]